MEDEDQSPDPLDVLNDFAPVNVQIKSTESLKGVPSRNSQSNEDEGVLIPSTSAVIREHHAEDDELFNILDVMDHSEKNKTTDTKSDIEVETEMNTASNKMMNKHITPNKSPVEKVLVQRTKSDSPRRRPAFEDQVEEKVQLPNQESSASASLVGSPTGSATALALSEQESPEAKKSPARESVNSSPPRPAAGQLKKGKDPKQMAEEAEAMAMQAKQNKLQQQQAQKELKENKLGLNGNYMKKVGGNKKEGDKEKEKGDKSDRPEATDRSEKETGRDRGGKDKERKQGRERRRSQQDDEAIASDENVKIGKGEDSTKLPSIKGSNNGSVQKLLSKVSNATGLKGKGVVEAEKRVNEKLAAEKVRLPRIQKTKAQASQQQEKMMSKDDSHDEQEGNDDDDQDGRGGDDASVVSRQSLLQVPPHSSPAGSQTSKRQGKSKKPLFMRMIAKARRQIMKEEQAKQEEYNKLKQNRPHRVPTRNELKEHMHKFNEMMKVHQEQQQKNHVENIRALRQARKKMEEKLSSIESIYVSDQEEGAGGGDGDSMVSGSESHSSPSPKKKLKRQQREKEKEKNREKDGESNGDALNNNHHDDDNDSVAIDSSPSGKHQSSPLKKRFTTPANKMEVVSSAAPLSPRSPRVPVGEKGGKGVATSPRSMKIKKSKSTDEEEPDGSPRGKSLFGKEGEDSDKSLDGGNSIGNTGVTTSEPLTPRAIATEVTNDWLGRLLSTESLAMFD